MTETEKANYGDQACDALRQELKLPGTKLTERGLTVSMRPQPGESVAFYRLDHPSFRRYFGAQRTCDLAIHWRIPNTPPAVALVELKGADFSHAVKQLSETWDRSRACILGMEPAALVQAWVLIRRSAPSGNHTARRDFKRDTGLELKVKNVQGRFDAGDWLRASATVAP